MKHRHAEMIKAKADNMELVTFVYHGPVIGWLLNSTNQYAIFDESLECFLCLPKHKEVCLHWLDGGEIQYKTIKYGWMNVDECNQWSNNCVFMDLQNEFRIKPRTEKRWVAVNRADKTEVYSAIIFKSKDDAEDVFDGKYWQFIEIEVEV